MKLRIFRVAALAVLTIACGSKSNSRHFGQTQSGDVVDLYTLTNRRGMEVSISTYGGVVVSLKVPDRTGAPGDVVLGFDNLEGYLKPNPYFGAIVGRYGNRIAHGQFTLDGVEYTLAKNNGENSLHGGNRGFDKRIWTATNPADIGYVVGIRSLLPWRDHGAQSLELTYQSKDGEEGYPGNLSATVTYTLTDNNALRIDYAATTDKDTVVNLTNHSYFNLAGQGNGDVLGHQVTVFADRFTPVDKTMIPTGELRNVQGTPFDFRRPHAIGERINASDEQLRLGRGYDHNFVLNRTGSGLELAARVSEPKTGRVLEVLTTEPGVQFYTANFLDGTLKGKGGKVYGPRSAFCLETQHFPDSPNKADFPSVVLKPGGRYRTTTVYHFSADSRR